MRRTPLYEKHLEAGARLVDFAGWQMPVQYDGVKEEHLRVREAAGMFDVSHMGEIETSGPGAADLLQRLLSNDVSKLEVGGAQYSVLCQEDGGILDDLFTYRLDDGSYLTVTNASNHARDFEWFAAHAGDFDAQITDSLENWAMLAIQGPQARGMSAGLFDGPLPARMHTARLGLFGGDGEALVCGTGYTGEDGVEVLVAAELAASLWEGLTHAGVQPAGLGARDTLRLEACFHLYGNDMDTSRNPIEAGLGWCCKEATGFIGADAVASARNDGTEQRLAPFMLTDRGIPRQGNTVALGDDEVGAVTSGSFSPSLDVGIGMAYLRSDLIEPGTEIEIDVRGKRRPARVESKPLYDKEK